MDCRSGASIATERKGWSKSREEKREEVKEKVKEGIKGKEVQERAQRGGDTQISCRWQNKKAQWWEEKWSTTQE